MCDEAVLHAVARALQGLERPGFVVPDAAMAEYLASARRIADAELAGVPTESAEAAVRYVVLGRCCGAVVVGVAAGGTAG